MSRLASKPATVLDPLLRTVTQANKSLRARNDGGGLLSFYEVLGSSNQAAIAANFFDQGADENFAPACVRRYVSRLVLGHCFGVYPAPGGTASFCFGCAALRVMVPP